MTRQKIQSVRTWFGRRFTAFVDVDDGAPSALTTDTALAEELRDLLLEDFAELERGIARRELHDHQRRCPHLHTMPMNARGYPENGDEYCLDCKAIIRREP